MAEACSRLRGALPAHVLAALLAVSGALAQSGSRAPVPDGAALAAARTQALERLADDVLQLCNGDLAAAQKRLFAVAATANAATRFVLLEQSASLAERHHAPMLALAALAQLERDFEIPEATTLALLERLAGDPTTPAAAVAGAALQEAERAAQRPDVQGMGQLHAIAVRAAARSDDVWLQGTLANELTRLRELHAGWSRWCGGEPTPAQKERAQLFAPLFLFPERLGVATLGQIAEELQESVDAKLAAKPLHELGPERLLALSQRATSSWVRRSLQHLAHSLLGSRYRTAANADESTVIARQMTGITALLADQDGLTRLRFRTERDRQQLVITAGKWRIEEGLLLGLSDMANNFATHRYAFENIRSVVIRGGIRSPAGLNFRLAVGELNLLCNWEVRPENHLWARGVQLTKGPPALTAGKEHTIALHATDAGVLVFVDDQLWFTAHGSLAGTVCVYPSLGSEIFVREILIDGELAIEGPVQGPRGELR